MKIYKLVLCVCGVLLPICLTSYPNSKNLSNPFLPDSTPEFEFRYHNYSESTNLLKDLAARYPQLCKLYSIGKSATGKREIWCLEVGNQGSANPMDKPAVYFDGNQHDIEVIGGEVTLFLAYHLLSRYGKDPEVTQLLDTRVVYIIQRADPDGAEAFISGQVDWDPAKIPGQKDDDGDGHFGEDGPEDIDGDGEILKMRILDPQGEWVGYTADNRILVKRTSDTKGPFYRLIDEGIDNDRDGQINEDPPRTRFISNRNFPAFWSSADSRLRGSGDYPLQEHNSKVLADFILSRPHISQVESYHSTSGIFVRPLGSRPDSEIPMQDLQDYTSVLSRGTEMTDYPPASLYHDFTDIEPNLPPDQQPRARRGVFIDWTYWQRGIFSVSTELWTMEPFVNAVGWGDIPRDRRLHAIPGRYRRPDVQTAVLKWLDNHKDDPALNGQGYLDWKSFDHPQLGQVELGGFTKYWLFNVPPGPYFRRTLEDQARFAVYRALLTPLVRIKSIEIDPNPSDPGKWTVVATAVNLGYFDTSMEQARRTGVAKQDRLILYLPEGAQTESPIEIVFPFMWGTRGGSFLSLYRGTWDVHADPGIVMTIEIQSEKGGIHREEAALVSR